MDESSVRVAVRIRPTIPREKIQGCHTCTRVTPDQPQVWMGETQAFTFDYVFDTDATQENVFSTTIESLVNGCVEGYNATIVAYGQTGSGKTHTMGTGFDTDNVASPDIVISHGIIPRAVHHLFHKIQSIRKAAKDNDESQPEFQIRAQFVELHNEEINDLISSDIKVFRQGKNGIKIHEDAEGGIYIVGVGSVQVNSPAEALTCLRDGALVRSTASTNMNDSSSRSHAIFTLHIVQQRYVKPTEGDDGSVGAEFETLSAKFHFVDLAGSERLKRTGAVGDRAKEGISINCGLLALGNVISALGDKSKKSTHIPYRDSKLTRLLQDSLGGNSQTLMIACISPCDRDFVETLNTLKYANRARNIKNKLTINQDKSSRVISTLRQEISRLENELFSYKQGRITMGENGEEVVSDLYQENIMLNAELNSLRSRVKALQETCDRITASNADLIAEKACGGLTETGDGASSDLVQLIRKYTHDIEDLRAKLLESEATCELLKRKQTNTVALLNQSLSPRSHIAMTPRPGTAPDDYGVVSESISNLLKTAKAEVKTDKNNVRKLRRRLKQDKILQHISMSNGDRPTHALENGDNNDNDDDGSSAEEEESDQDYSEEEDEDEGNMQAELANINDQINTKQRLIEQLELSNKRAVDTKEQYEQQIAILAVKIRHTEEERDKVLSSLPNKANTATTTKIKQVRDEYEAKLSTIQRELRRIQDALKEHNVLVKKNASTEKELGTLRGEVDNMKRLKVKLQNQLKEDNSKWREADAKRAREILQLKKDQRKKEVQIRALESKDKLKEQILRRKHEEVNALKKQSKSNLSRRAAGKLHSASIKRSPVKGKKKWLELCSSFKKKSADRKALEQFETEMLTHIENRKTAKEEMEFLILQREKNEMGTEEINRLNDEIDSLNTSLEYSDAQIGRIQRIICEFTSGSPKMEQNPDISLAMEHLTQEDCEYLMKKMYEYTVENLEEYKETSTKLTIAEQRIELLTAEVATLGELLSHCFAKYCEKDPNLSPDLSGKILKARIRRVNNNQGGTNEEIHSIDLTNIQILGLGQESRTTSSSSSQNGCGSYPESPTSSSHKFEGRQFADGEKIIRKTRRLTSAHQLIKSVPHSNAEPPLPVAPLLDDSGFARPAPVDSRGLMRSISARGPNTSRKVDRRNTFVIRDEGFASMPNTDSQNNVTTKASVPALPTFRKTNNFLSKTPRAFTPLNPPTNGVSGSNASFLHAPTDNFDFDTTFIADASNGPASAPGSPNSTRKIGNENVFQRLTSSTSGVSLELKPQVGIIRAVRDKASQKSPFQLTHVADGHSKAVLDMFATEDRLFTGAKDTTVKIWDLATGKELTTLVGSPTNISCVKFCVELNLLFCVSACYVRIFDVRENNCIKTLSSAGVSFSQDPPTESYLQFSTPELQITSLAVSHATNSLYTSFGQCVRLWDLRNFNSLGIIPGKHLASVMCMAAQSVGGISTLVTGSKDHSIKVYDYHSPEPMMNISIPPKETLDPPHYDGIECFALSGDTLFSGGRDFCIKKWELNSKSGRLLMAYNNAHSGWITGLCLPPSHPPLLVSASRDGIMKLWHTDSPRGIAHIEAHKGGMNCLTANSSAIFTASNVGQLKFWRLTGTTLNSSYILTPQKRQLVNRLLPPSRRRHEDIMTMSTGEGSVGLWKLRKFGDADDGSPVMGALDAS